MDSNKIEITKKHHREKGKIGWPAAFIIVSIVATFTIYKSCSNVIGVSSKITNNIKDTFHSDTKIEHLILGTIGELKKESKLVVLTVKFPIIIERSSTRRILWNYLNLGTTVVEIKVFGNKVQYIIPTDAISKDTFHWDKSLGKVIIHTPKPILDEEMVDVQSDPSKIKIRKQIGWARLDSYFNKTLEEKIRHELRSVIILQGKHELYLERAQKNAKEVIRNIFEQFMKKEKIEVPVLVN